MGFDKTNRIVFAGVVTEEDILKGAEEKLGTAWIRIEYCSSDRLNFYGFIEAANNGKIDLVDYTSEEFKAAFEGRQLSSSSPVIAKLYSDYEKIDKNDVWNSIRKFIKEEGLEIHYKEEKEYEDYNENEIKGPRL